VLINLNMTPIYLRVEDHWHGTTNPIQHDRS
jgi:hypothetical protein